MTHGLSELDFDFNKKPLAGDLQLGIFSDRSQFRLPGPKDSCTETIHQPDNILK